MDYTVNTSKGPVRFHSVGEPITEVLPDPCARCGKDYTEHGPYGRCQDWTPATDNDPPPSAPYFQRTAS